MAKWYTDQTVVAADKNLGGFTSDVLKQLVSVARNQVIAIRPFPAEPVPGEDPVTLPDDEVPEHWAYGQLLQIQALAKANKAGPGDVTGPEGYTVRVFPMDWNIVNVLRPKTNDADTLAG